MFYHLQNLFWGFCPGGFWLGGFCRGVYVQGFLSWYLNFIKQGKLLSMIQQIKIWSYFTFWRPVIENVFKHNYTKVWNYKIQKG